MLVKIDPNGNELSAQTFGGAGCDEAFAIARTTDGHYVLAGNTSSSGAGGVDGWTVKVGDLD